jgi:hypothetical protein
VNAWRLVAISVDEAAGTIDFFDCGASDSGVGTYVTPSAANATNTMELGALGGASGPLLSGSRMAAVCAWEGRALTVAELNSIFAVTRERFGV